MPSDPVFAGAVTSTLATRGTSLTDLVRSLQAQHKQLTADEIDRCAALVNAMPLSFGEPQDPSTWTTPEVRALPTVPSRQHYDPRTGHMIVTLIDPEDFYV